MTIENMEKQPFEDVSPIRSISNGDFPLSCYFLGG